jgi:hypothetical protein
MHENFKTYHKNKTKKCNTSYPLAAYNDLNKKYKQKRRQREE